MMHGGHLIHHWSSTQSTVALSSAEAELNGITKGMVETMLVKHFCNDFRCNLDIVLKTDSSAAVGIAQRQGAGKVKHLECRQLWVQERLARKEIRVQKIPREINASDVLTHHWTASEGLKHFPHVNIRGVGAD